MPVSVATLGLPIPGFNDYHLSFIQSDLLDKAAIIIATPFEPPFEPVLAEQMKQTKQDIAAAVSKGATCFILQSPYDPIFQADPKTDSPLQVGDNYEWLPLPPYRAETGTDILYRSTPTLDPLWQVIRPYGIYHVVFTNPLPSAWATTGTKAAISGLFRMGKGRYICLPGIEWQHPDLYLESEEYWTPEALDLAKNLIQELVNLHHSFTQKG